jgi:hypothetical protein
MSKYKEYVIASLPRRVRKEGGARYIGISLG